MPALEKDVFFERQAEQGLALTYDDVEVVPGSRDFDISDIDLRSRFANGVELKLPVVSAAMDTVTESDMAIAVAKLGGLGVIHAGLSVSEQRHEVRRVKKHLNARVDTPITLTRHRTLEHVLRDCEKNKWDFRTFPVVDKEGVLVGMLTQGDIDFAEAVSRRVGTVMTPLSELLTMPPETTPRQAYKAMRTAKKKTVPLIDDDGKLSGLYLFSDVKRQVIEKDQSSFNLDTDGRLIVAAAVPTDQEAFERIEAMGKYLDVVVLDTAQGDTHYAIDTLRELKTSFPELPVVVGNITNPASARMLAEAGADGIKVGQGPGSICTTRIEAGIGMPQISAVYDCVKAVEEDYDIPVCADGGIAKRGDITAAIVAGAHNVMLGSMLAGTDEAPVEIIRLADGSRVVPYRGMGSADAMRDNSASRKRYSAQGQSQPLPEGVSANVSYKGSVVSVLQQCRQALIKGMGYSGHRDIQSLRENGRFIRHTSAGLHESHPHDVEITSR